ncbi:MAG: IPExxxVDY family protein [Bacteroidota bacterium]
MAARFELDIEYDYDFQLLGIASHLPDYRLCWAINRQLGFNLQKSENPIKTLQKDKLTYVSFDVFCHTDEEHQVEYFLIDNINSGIRLLPEQQQADYLLMVKGMHASGCRELMQAVNKIDKVLTTFAIEVESLKSKEKLLF